MKITYYGHSAFGIATGTHHLLFDPYISENPMASHVDVESIPADFIFLSHGHGDHVGDVERIAKRTDATVITIGEIANWLTAKGIKTHGMNVGGDFAMPFGRVKGVVAVHSSTLPDGTPGGIPLGFVVSAGNSSFYFAGDTGLTRDMELIANRYDLDFALLPIGSNYTMDYIDAEEAAGMIMCDHIIGMHYDTFPPIKIDHDEARKYFDDQGKTLTLMGIGETIEI